MSRRSLGAATKLERVAASMNSGALVDFLQMHVNSVGTATAMYAETGDPISFDVILENTEAIRTIASVLQSRVKESPYSPAPDPRLEALKDAYLRKRQSSGQTSRASLLPGVPEEIQVRL